MIRLFLIVCSLLVTTAFARAADFQCPSGVDHQLTPVLWTAFPDGTGMYIRLGVLNPEPIAVTMADIEAWFIDPLGRVVGESAILLDPDINIAANSGVITLASSTSVHARLVGLTPEDVKVVICTRAVLYEDGTVVDFE